MSDVTVRQLAEVLALPLEKLLSQLGEAGISVSSADQSVTNTEKMKLLGFLRRSHGKAEKEEVDVAPKQITLKRKTISEIKVASSTGKGSKTVNVEFRSRKTYLNRKAADEAPVVDDFRETARKLLAESEAERQANELEVRAIEDARKNASESQKRAVAEEVSRREKEEHDRVAAVEKLKTDAEELVKREAGEIKRKEERAKPDEDRTKPKHAKPPIREIDEDVPAVAVPIVREVAPPTRYGRKELHVTESNRASANTTSPNPSSLWIATAIANTPSPNRLHRWCARSWFPTASAWASWPRDWRSRRARSSSSS